MKKYVLYSFLYIAACSTMSISAHAFKFSNYTNEELKVMIQLAGINEPWYDVILAPKAEHTFGFGPEYSSFDRPEWWKGISCLLDMKIQTPLMGKKETTDAQGNVQVTWERKKDSLGKPMWNPARNLEVFYIKNEAYDAMIAAGGKLADGLGESAGYGQCKGMHFVLIPTTDAKAKFNVIAVTKK